MINRFPTGSNKCGTWSMKNKILMANVEILMATSGEGHHPL